MTDATPSRFAAVHGRLRVTRRLATAGAIVAFAAVAGLARNSHPGTSSGASSGNGDTVQQQSSDDSSSSFDYGNGAVAPSTGSSAPSIQSSGS
jgi:hypothetical protein